jgi:predicted nuclease with TOPRIM domain
MEDLINYKNLRIEALKQRISFLEKENKQLNNIVKKLTNENAGN